ncbi:MAG: PAS domain S-box protein [Sphingobacteriales bacterium]|nr:MAG: PAS domain S-box protein [Sphingobacteriales bacterium]
MQVRIFHINNLPVAVYICNNEGYITYYNRAAVKIWGREPEIGMELWNGSSKLYYADGSPLPIEVCPMALTIKHGVAVEGEEIILQRPDGTKRNILPYPVPVYNAAGELTGATNTLIDITDQKVDDGKQSMLAAIIESSDDAIISKTLDGIITSWNFGAQKLFGYTENEIVGRHITKLIPIERINEEDEIIGKIRQGKGVAHYETIRMSKTGEQIQISLTVSPIRNSKGVIIGASKIARDITRQKNTENRLQRYAESLEVLNNFGKVVSENMEVESILQKVTDATTQLTGAAYGSFFYNQADERGEPFTLFAFSGAPREAFEHVGMPGNSTISDHTFKNLTTVRVDDSNKDTRYNKNAPYFGIPAGHQQVASYLAIPVISKSGTVIGGLFYGHPDTGRFTFEHEQLVAGVSAQAAIALDNAKLYEEIKVLNSKKDEFIGLASHELKTPVTSINGYLQIVERNLDTDDRNKMFVSKARLQVGKLASLIADLLDVSKIQTGKLPFTYASFDMLHLLNEVAEMMHQTNTSHAIEFDFDDTELMVYADQQRIEQVIINLISNAVKYSPNADRIIIRASAANNKIKVSVQDFGIGIEKEQHDRIFSRFYRVENLAAHMSGLGIGLYITNEIIKRHKGKLHVASTIGEGSVFSFEIPVSQPVKA